ncbi:interleukin-17 receptor C isoform X1 [Salmo trutta]|uniref:interleukin-17 receptor C isoform X1 n=1 Tax=Salmo trutta TaxID=8032 RepID=UPI001131F647|nr:interleukin-17 receptor C-like isoform X1 [Salmo trutta]
MMMRRGNRPALAVLLLLFFLLRLLCASEEITRARLTVTEIQYQNGSNWNLQSLPQLSLSTLGFSPSQGSCFACVHVRVRMKAADFTGTLTIKYLELSTRTPRTISIKNVNNDTLQWSDPFRPIIVGKTNIKRLHPHDIGHVIVWELVYDCFPADAGREVYVSLSSKPQRQHRYIVQEDICPGDADSDPVPEFDLSVDELARSLNVTVATGDHIYQPALSSDVYTRLCYRHTDAECSNLSALFTINTNQNRSVTLSFPYLLPCVCVQVYYTHLDARRTTVCPFVNGSLAGGRDVWGSSNVTLYGELSSSMAWSALCPAAYLKPSASLCWRHQRNTPQCTPILNSTLEDMEKKGDLNYNVSAVDKHPQMCVQFSFRGSHDVRCPFQPGMSKWEAYVGPGSQSLCVYLTSTIPASFAAQLCVWQEKGCVSRGAIYLVNMGGGTRETQLNLPLSSLTEGLCVQVWRSDPAQYGRRLLCPDYSNRRRGLYAVAVLTLLVTVAMLGSLIRYVTKKGVTGWLFIQRPVLLVCSSEQSAHVSAVCALASFLQGELCADVRMALWTQSSIGACPGAVERSWAGVAELGPVPWLYGQWEAVREAGGQVLIVWSAVAKESYRSWREEREGGDRREGKKTRGSKGEEMQQGERGGEKMEELEKTRVEQEQAGMKKGEEWKESRSGEEREPSSVTGPVFRAALSCLLGARQGASRVNGFTIVYFQGLCHSRDIPKDLRGVPRYCLPRDFGGLIRELDGTASGRNSVIGSWDCWPRLLSKTLSLWLARRLTHRLRVWLSQEEEGLKLKSSQEVISERTLNRHVLSLSTNEERTEPSTLQQKELLSGSPWQ